MIGAGTVVTAGSATADEILGFEIQSLDGHGNNLDNPEWGQAGTNYSRFHPARYTDGRGGPVRTRPPRYISNRIFNDSNQNLFSETGVTQWGFAWGQFLDHTFGLRQAPGVGNAPDPSSQNIPFDNNDPLEEFTNDFGEIPFTRSSIADGTGVTNARQQVNTLSSYIDTFSVYGGNNTRLEWLRDGSVDGNITNNRATLFLPNGHLPRRDARGNAATAPAMDVDGRLRAQPNRAAVAGDVRANENIALQATHTLFAREHNRIVNRLPRSLSEEARFQIARRVVIAEQQYITYNEFLPALGVTLPSYRGYNPRVNSTLGNEFATFGYRAHSMIHGELEMEAEADRYTEADLDRLEALGVEVVREPGSDELELVVPLNVAFFNPDLLELVQLGPALQGLGLEPQYKNDEQIDNQLRSVLFEIPVPGNPECLDGPTLPECFRNVVDLGAIDIERGGDHGMPSYNQARQALGLPAKTSFRSVTGESTESFPRDPELTPGREIDDPDSLDFVRLFDADGNEIELGSPEADSDAVTGIRRTTTAARLRALYGSVNTMDAFTGMISERHVPGTNFGELQLAIWKKQFAALRDGDRFFYGNDPGLSEIRQKYGIDYRVRLSQVIAANTDIPLDDLAENVFLAEEEEPPAPAAWAPGVAYKVGDEVTHKGATYRCRQAHTSQSDWEPQLTPALWLRL
ncbi:MAG TPA: peroxidase family protein [Pilimelia sp.]|nr:peroxidase family protein [Pilimelia sp.]